MRTRTYHRRGRIAGAVAVLAISTAVTPRCLRPFPATPGALIHGVGHFTYDEPGLHGHRIRFNIHARVAAEALVAAVVPEGHGNVRNHGFYLKIIDGTSARPDQIETVQAQNGLDRPPRYCIDTAVDPTAKRYPIDRGGYLIRR